MKTQLPPPIAPHNFEKMCKEWTAVILMQESGIWIWPALNAPYRRIWQFQEDKLLQKKLFGEEAERQLLIFIDLPHEETISANTLHKHLIQGIMAQTNESVTFEQSLDEVLKSVTKDQHKVITFFITGGDSYIKSGTWSVLEELNSLARYTKNTHILLFIETDITDPIYLPYHNRRTTLLHHITVAPLYTTEDVPYFIHYLSEKWNMSVSDEQMNWIITNCGGHFLFVKEAMRQIKKILQP